MAPPLNSIKGNARNNYLYGTSLADNMDGDAGNDYLRGYAGNDSLKGGTGADRFVFERTQAANGIDTIQDYNIAQGDVLDFSLVGFARGVFNRAAQLSDVIRIKQGPGNTARLLIDLDGGGNSFQEWALLQNVTFASNVRLSVGANSYTAQVTNHPPVVTSFTVSGVNQLSVTADDAVTAGLYLQGTGTVGAPGTLGTLVAGTAIGLAAYTPGTINVVAQGAVTTAQLRISDSASNVAAPEPDPLVHLGTNGDDTITGSGGSDIIFGFDGGDTIDAGAGADTVQGDDGNDRITGGAGADHLSGGDGDDTFVFATQAELAQDTNVDGGAGIDTIIMRGTTLESADFARVTGMERLHFEGTDHLSVTLGTHTNAAFAAGITIAISPTAASLTVNGAASTVAVHATGTLSNDLLTGGAAGDTLLGGLGNDSLTGNAGNDSLTGSWGQDTLLGGEGDDLLQGGEEADTLTGGIGADQFVLEDNDTVTDFNSTEADTVSIGALANGDAVTFTTVTGTLNLSGSLTTAAFTATAAATGATITGGAGNDSLTGAAGNDSLAGGIGNDTLTGAGGADTLTGGTGNDRFNVDAGTDAITDLGGNDVLVVSAGAIANAAVTAHFIATAATVNNGTANLTLGNGINADLLSVNAGLGYSITAAGNIAASLIMGSGLDDTLTGGNGDDTLEGLGGDDALTGGAGNDTFVVGAGTDTITDLGGSDVLVVAIGATANATVAADFTATAATVNNGTANLTLANGINANLSSVNTGLGYSITAAGNAAASYILGSAFNDTLTGGNGDDTLESNAGDDALTGGAGNDTFAVGAGTDTITDLGGSDVLVVSAGATANATVTADFTATAVTSNLGTASLTLGNGIDANLDLAIGNVGYRITAAGNALASIIVGSDFADTLIGGLDNDSLTGGTGNDTLTGGAGNDTFTVDADTDTITDLGDSDVLVVTMAAIANATVAADFTATADTVNNGIANLTLNNGIDADMTLATGSRGYAITAASNSLASTIVGSGFADSLTGGNDDDTLDGNDGNDTLTGGAGNDTITGGAGADAMNGGVGNNVFAFSTGDVAAGETVAFDGASDAFRVDATTDFSLMNGGLLLTGLDVVTMAAGQGATFLHAQLTGLTLTVNGDNNGATEVLTVNGTADPNTINLANVTVQNGAGLSINGNDGADVITGTAGNDTITGGVDADRIDVGAGIDKVIVRVGDSGLNAAAPATAAVSTTAFDVYSGLGAGDTLELFLDVTWNAFGLVATSNTDVSGSDNTIKFIRGTYDSGGSLFTAGAAGADTLVTYDLSTPTGGQAPSYQSIVLVGFVGLSDVGVSGTGMGANVTLVGF